MMNQHYITGGQLDGEYITVIAIDSIKDLKKTLRIVTTVSHNANRISTLIQVHNNDTLVYTGVDYKKAIKAYNGLILI